MLAALIRMAFVFLPHLHDWLLDHVKSSIPLVVKLQVSYSWADTVLLISSILSRRLIVRFCLGCLQQLRSKQMTQFLMMCGRLVKVYTCGLVRLAEGGATCRVAKYRTVLSFPSSTGILT